MSKAGDTVKGAAGGAATGATIGSVVPGYGTAVGAAVGGVVGGIGGYLSSHDPAKGFRDRAQIEDIIKQGYYPGGISQQTAAQTQAAQLNMGGDPFRQGQMQQIGQLQGIASGQQQGAGELAAHRQYGQAIAAQQAMARMQRGGGAGQAYRNMANQSAALGSTAAGMGQQAALQDQMNAQGMLSGALNYGRGADINVAGQNAGFQQQAGLANAGFQQQNQQQNAQNYLALLNSLQGMNATEYTGQNAINAQNQQSNNALLGAGIGAAGNYLALAQQRNQGTPAVAAQQQAPTGNLPLMASDERLKTGVTDSGREIDDMLDKLTAKAWTYKDPKHGAGRWSGILAQDMERSEAGRRIVENTPEGKMLDVKKTLSTALAAAARLNARLRAVEDR